MNFDDFFHAGTGNTPYDYQRRLAGGDGGHSCESLLIDIPTGLGKTAAVVLAWLWNRVAHAEDGKGEAWPRRLVYCLPMRTLVEQTEEEVIGWVRKLHEHSGELGLSTAAKGDLEWLLTHSPVVLMGGEDLNREKAEWDVYPEKPAILIGTQDMLLSRALNRGYGMSRYRWPMHFALLNNDTLWVLDEVQLMGVGLPTTAQLAAFREAVGVSQTSRSWWMSATTERGWLETVDFKPEGLAKDFLPEKERANLHALLDAPKRLEPSVNSSDDLKKLAGEIVKAAEQRDGLTLVVVNRVKTARLLHAAVRKTKTKVGNEALLLHSRFRPDDRARILKAVLAAEKTRRLVISTQVIEAGVDISATLLFTELAPWSSLVQRFGRCNRRGQLTDARVVWFEAKDPAPYELAQLDEARARLRELAGVSPNELHALHQTKGIPACDRPRASHVIRRKDLIELFDTTPDLAGNDIDIDRWVREADESSVQVFWRTWEGGNKGGQPRDQCRPARDELCPVGLSEFRPFTETKGKSCVWRWDFLEGEWQRVDPKGLYPGQVYLLPAEAGGYVGGEDGGIATGWTPDSSEVVKVVAPANARETDVATDSDELSETSGRWQSVAQHTDDVCSALKDIFLRLPLDRAALLRIAARWHDWGKAHAAFQAKLRDGTREERTRELGSEPAAKAPESAWLPAKLPDKPCPGDRRRKFFRHELASALAVLQPETPLGVAGEERDLVAYVIAAHHGKVRLSIRSLPGEWLPCDECRFARGVWDDDPLPNVFLGGNGETAVTTPKCTLSLEPMELGLGEKPPFTDLPSWSERMLALRDNLGPFRLAFLEMLLRAADERASALASRTVQISPQRSPK